MYPLLCRIIQSKQSDVYENLALEECLLHSIKQDEVMLYLWQNQNAIVIGRNQNVYNECLIDSFLENHGQIARRLSGGGAVYHDLGNLNFTMILPRNLFDIQKQLKIIIVACNHFGITPVINERFDLLADGKKFSGNAFYHRKDASLHHGTVLINSDIDKIDYYLQTRYLPGKNRAVHSTRSPVLNLSILNQQLTVPLIQEALIQSFLKLYEGYFINDDPANYDSDLFKTRYLSKEWTYGKQENREERYTDENEHFE